MEKQAVVKARMSPSLVLLLLFVLEFMAREELRERLSNS